MNILRAPFKLGVTALIGGVAIACTYSVLDVDSHLLSGLLRVVGIHATRQTGKLVREIIVTAGNELTISGDTRTISPVTPGELDKRLGWAGMYEKGGWLAFRGQSLGVVVAEFNRHNNRQLRIGDPRTAVLQVGGNFRVTDVDGFVAALGVTHGVRATVSRPGGHSGDSITLSGGRSPGSAEPVEGMGPPQQP